MFALVLKEGCTSDRKVMPMDPSIEKLLINIVAEISSQDASTITSETMWTDLVKWDSLSLLELMSAVESTMAIQLNPDDLTQCAGIHDFAIRLVEHCAVGGC